MGYEAFTLAIKMSLLLKSIGKITPLQDKAMALGFHPGLCVSPDAGFRHFLPAGGLAEFCC